MKQIGWDSATKLLYNIQKKLDRVMQVVARSEGGSAREPANRESTVVLFDQDYISGIDGAAITGNITFDFTDAKRGTTTYMKHIDASAFTFGSEAVLMFNPVNISTTVPNFFCFILLDKTIGSEIVHVSLEQEGV